MPKSVCKECGAYIKANSYEHRETYQPALRGSIVSDIGNTDAELFLTKGIPYLSKKTAVQMGQYYGSDL